MEIALCCFCESRSVNIKQFHDLFC